MPIAIFKINNEKATLQRGNIIGYTEADYSPGIQILHFFKGEVLNFYFRGEKNNVLLTVFNCQLNKLAFGKKAKEIATDAGYNIAPLAKEKFPEHANLKWAYKVV